MKKDNLKRCSWTYNDTYIKYHDNEWGKIVKDDKTLFKLLCLEGQSTGLSFHMILDKKELYEKYFNFDNINDIAKMNDDDILEILNKKELINNFKKLKSIPINAIAYLKLIKDHKTLYDFLWKHINYKQQTNIDKNIKYNELSYLIATKMKKYGFQYIGKTIIFSYMQSIGMYDDHEENCYLKTKTNQ